jgi:hypothetical protein
MADSVAMADSGESLRAQVRRSAIDVSREEALGQSAPFAG